MVCGTISSHICTFYLANYTKEGWSIFLTGQPQGFISLTFLIISNADWLIDMGPENEIVGGEIFFEGTPH